MHGAARAEVQPVRAIASSGAAIQVCNVTQVYGEAHLAKTVVEDCSFEIEKGKLTVMVGPSGCGKSTLIRLIAGFEKPTSGQVIMEGRPVDGPDRDRLVVFQETALFPWMTTYDNIMFGPRVRHEVTADTRDAVDRLLDTVGLRQFRHKYPTQLSGGMQRRAELARAMINRPHMMILDEPFRGLDAMSKVLMWDYYARLFEGSERTDFFVTTDIDEGIFLADRIFIMTNKPARVRAILEVDLPRPRNLSDIVQNDRANAIKMEALSLLHEEAMKSFTGGSKAATDFIDAYTRRFADEKGASTSE